MDYDDEASDPLFLDAMHAIVLLFGAEPDDAKLAALARILVQLAADYEKTLGPVGTKKAPSHTGERGA